MKIKIWYANWTFEREAGFPGKDAPLPTVKLGGMNHSHMELPELFGFEEMYKDGDDHDDILDRAFRFFNWVDRDFSAPVRLGEWLRSLKVGYDVFDADEFDRVWHSSMSVGDIVEIDGIKYMCASAGWDKLDI